MLLYNSLHLINFPQVFPINLKFLCGVGGNGGFGASEHFNMGLFVEGAGEGADEASPDPAAVRPYHDDFKKRRRPVLLKG